MSALLTQPLNDSVHPLLGRSTGRMRSVTATFKVVVSTQVETALINLLLQHVVDTCILVPVGRTDPDVGNLTNLGKNLLQIGTSRPLDIGDIQLVGTQTHKDVVGVDLVDQFGESCRLTPLER